MTITAIKKYKGDTWVFNLTIQNNGVPYNLTGCTIESCLLEGPTVTQDLTAGTGLASFIDPINGIISLQIPDSLTSTIEEDADGATDYPTRVQVRIRDSQGVRTTYGIIYIYVRNAGDANDG